MRATDLLDNVTAGPNGCWVWTRGTKPNGYGTAFVDGRTVSAHRLIYETTIGPIPEGAQIDHLCRTRRCIRPDHLEAVTPRENSMRGMHPNVVAHRAATCRNGHPRPPSEPRASVRTQCPICAAANRRALAAMRRRNDKGAC